MHVVTETAKELSQDFAASTGKTISRQTVYRCLAEKAIYARWPVSRFGTNGDSRQVFIWREPETRYSPSKMKNQIDMVGVRFLFGALC
ncbi:hypothetical protein TNCV_327621 [Trichonephila clavipes]|nr:hypothetical protein TNCV_327621 [Trichonephila clavipes]